MNENKCPLCKNSTAVRKKYYLKHVVYQCKACKLEFCSDAVFNTDFISSLNENEREKALRLLRKENFRKILNAIQLIDSNSIGLEVGCGYGWFLESCKGKGIKCEGIEPETRFNSYYLSNDFIVRNGFYPDIVNENEQYDFIAFNDVLEHIPDLETTMTSNYRLLKNGGLLIVNIPLQEGLFYFFSKIAYRFGFKDLLNRMWQFDFHSPHLYYFRKKNVIGLGHRYGLKLHDSFKLRTIRISDIAARIKQDKNQGWISFIISYLGSLVLYPATKLFPDTYCFIFRKSK